MATILDTRRRAHMPTRTARHLAANAATWRRAALREQAAGRQNQALRLHAQAEGAEHVLRTNGHAAMIVRIDTDNEGQR